MAHSTKRVQILGSVLAFSMVSSCRFPGCVSCLLKRITLLQHCQHDACVLTYAASLYVMPLQAVLSWIEDEFDFQPCILRSANGTDLASLISAGASY